MSLTVFSAPLRAVRWLCVALLLGATTGVLADTAQPRVLVALPALHAPVSYTHLRAHET